MENPTSLFLSDFLEIWYRGNFEMLIIKSKPKFKSENDLSKKLQFSTDFNQNFTEHPSTIALPWQQWMSLGTGLHSEFKPVSHEPIPRQSNKRGRRTRKLG